MPSETMLLHSWREPGAVVFAIGGTIAPADVPWLRLAFERLLEETPPGAVVCDLGGLARCDVAVVSGLARLQLSAGRSGRRLALRRAPAELAAQIAFLGLEDALPP